MGIVVTMVGLVGCGQNFSENEKSPIRGESLRNDGQIIGGVEATGEEEFAKTVVSLYNVAMGSICTASILSDNMLLTAAHCVEGAPSDLRVVFGTNLETQDVIVQRVEAFRVSPFWYARQNQRLDTGDIAIVKFSGGLPEGYEPAELLTDSSLLNDNDQVLLAGYGNSNGAEGTGAGRLRFVETSIKQARYSRTEVLVEQSFGKGACHGDSGGPAYVHINGKRMLFGVTSRGVDDPKNDCSVSAAYTSVPYYNGWIVRTMRAMDEAELPTFEAAIGL